jgi:hypothetical protein
MRAIGIRTVRGRPRRHTLPELASRPILPDRVNNEAVNSFPDIGRKLHRPESALCISIIQAIGIDLLIENRNGIGKQLVTIRVDNEIYFPRENVVFIAA